jgi:hypothetical protein
MLVWFVKIFKNRFAKCGKHENSEWMLEARGEEDIIAPQRTHQVVCGRD